VVVLEGLQEQKLIQVDDYATVSWPVGAKKPKTKQEYGGAGRGALDGAFWGMLFGLIFFVPFLGAAIGAAFGALTSSMVDVGIDDDFIKKSRSNITEGTSALFLLSENAVVDRVVDAFKTLPAHELIASNLSAEQEAKLKEAFEA
jgi:uncharacterized membrane protein